MFSLDVVDTDKFLDMPVSAQALYFHLGMRADDDGFVSSPRKITSLIGSNADDLKILVSKQFIIPFDSGVIVIADWKVNNYLRSDRYKGTRYIGEMEQLRCCDGIYSMDTVGIPVADQMETQIRIGKESKVKDNVNTICLEPDKSAPSQSDISLPLVDKTFYNVPFDKIAIWKDAYPVVDVEQELRRMTSWLDSNPTKKKTRRGIERFINNWLARTQDKGGSSSQREVNQSSGFNSYDPDGGFERIKRIVDSERGNRKPGENLPFG